MAKVASQGSWFLVQPISIRIKFLDQQMFPCSQDKWILASDMLQTQSNKIMCTVSSLAKVLCTWFIHFLCCYIINMFIQASVKSSFRFAKIVRCNNSFLSRFVWNSLVGVDGEVDRTLFAFVTINNILSFAVYRRGNIVCVSSNV